MKLRWTPEAIQDRDGVYDYIQTDNPSAVLALDEKFSELARHLSQLRPLFKPDNTLTEAELQLAMRQLNNRPRRCLGWHTPNEVFFGPDSAEVKAWRAQLERIL